VARSVSKPLLGFAAVALLASIELFIIAKSGSGFIAVSGADSLSISTDALARGQVRFIRIVTGGRKASFHSRDSGGQVQAVMDACQRCYSYHKGYPWSHGYLVCKWCGNRYRLTAMESGAASCVPVKGIARVQIKSADLEHQRGLF
jgi:uncharacterized membrane protein